MAKQETIIMGEDFDIAVNVDATVGVRGINKPDDVKLIQALFKFITTQSLPPIKNFIGLSKNDLPKITGICDGKTNNAILKFQRANAKKLLSIDGIIHPAEYDNRILNANPGDFIEEVVYYEKGKTRRLMTMTLLHLYAVYSTNILEIRSYRHWLVQEAPELKSSRIGWI